MEVEAKIEVTDPDEPLYTLHERTRKMTIHRDGVKVSLTREVLVKALEEFDVLSSKARSA